ncbi:purine-cytosine permease-like protein [Streptomyces puniciscabiei]|uniref:Purine-cytosine permease-like protein n=1 Tax=Streptomyces puniciscabiei TaxID=164348 RepID=A0A542SXX8_9ACTN|nr:purine-cytosine permease-like protein [Streptomyces puniciscabiei]
MPPQSPDSPTAPPPSLTEVEPYGVERIPDADRTATPLDLFRVAFGGANTFSTCVLGAFPILFGLSFRQGLAATVLGVVAGALILCPMAVFGPVNGTNNAVSSSAHLGVHGRVVGSFLSLLTAVAFFSISVWSSGDALVGGAHRLFGLDRGTLSYVVAYALFAGLVLAVCVYGFRFMLFVNKIAVTSATVLFLLGAFAFAGDFDPSYAGVFTASADAATKAPQSAFWPSFIGASLIVLSNPVSFGAFLGDWSRYIPAGTPRRRVVGAAFLSQIATLLPFVFGLATASIIATKAPKYVDPAAPDFVGGLLAISPSWFFLPVCLLALIGGMSTGTTSLYGTGLDFSSVFPRLSRVQATLLVGVVSIAFIFVGRFGLDLVQSISTFATMIITCTTPWMVVMMLGFYTRRGWRPGRAAGLQPPSARRPLLVRARLELARYDRLVGGGGARRAVHEHPGSVRRPAGEPGERGRHQPAAVARGGRRPVPDAAAAVPRAPGGVRARGRPAGAHGRRPGASNHRPRCLDDGSRRGR